MCDFELHGVLGSETTAISRLVPKRRFAKLPQALAGALAPRHVQLGLAASQYSLKSAWWPAKALPALGAVLVTLEVRSMLQCSYYEKFCSNIAASGQGAAGTRRHARHTGGAERSRNILLPGMDGGCPA